MLPQEIQEQIFDDIKKKKQIEQSEKDKAFNDYIKRREEHNKKMDKYNSKYKDVVIPFGKYKGSRVYDIAVLKDRYYMPIGKTYLKWVSDNVEIKDKVLKKCIEFYKTYYYNPGDGYD